MITSRKNPIVLDLVRLKDRRGRLEANRILIEGETEVAEAARAGVVLEKLVCVPGTPAVAEIETWVGDDVQRVAVSAEVFEKLSFRQNPDGVLAVAQPPSVDLESLSIQCDSVFLVLDRIEKPGNLGAIARTARAAGASGILICGGCEAFNPNAIRSSRGHLFAVPIVSVNPPAVIDWARSKKVRLVVADPAAPPDLWSVEISGPVGLVLGEEHAGADPVWRETGAALVRIPMEVAMDSLNVSVSAALLLYEMMRRRGLAITGNSGLLAGKDAYPED